MTAVFSPSKTSSSKLCWIAEVTLNEQVLNPCTSYHQGSVHLDPEILSVSGLFDFYEPNSLIFLCPNNIWHI